MKNSFSMPDGRKFSLLDAPVEIKQSFVENNCKPPPPKRRPSRGHFNPELKRRFSKQLSFFDASKLSDDSNTENDECKKLNDEPHDVNDESKNDESKKLNDETETRNEFYFKCNY